MSDGKPLGVRVDGRLLAEADAREFWKRFSEHMEANRGDLAGFAVKEGLASVRPSVEAGGAVLVGSHSEAQRPYASVTASEPTNAPKRPARSTPGSKKTQARERRPAKKR